MRTAVTLFSNSLPAPVEPGTRAALGRERLWPAGSAGSLLQTERFPSSPRPPLRAQRPACPFPTPARLVPGEPSWPPHNAARSLLSPRVPTRRVSSARKEKQASLACVQPHLSVGRRERKTQPSVPRRSRQGRREKEDLFSRGGFNYGGFFTSYCGLYVYQGHIKTSLFLVGIDRSELSPYLVGAPSIPLKVCGGWYKNVSAALRVSPTHYDICFTTIRPRIMLSLK